MKSLNRIEIVVGGILVLIFLIWSFDRCQSNSSKYQPIEAPQEKVDPPSNQDNNNTSSSESSPTTTTTAPAPKPVQPVVVAPVQTYSAVFIHTDKLKLRDQPFVKDSKILMELPRGMELSYLGNKTTYKDKFTLDNVAYDAPWLEVQTKDGRLKGWVYGGGVKAYKPD